MIGNLVSQTVTNSGTGNMTLGAARDGFTDIASLFVNSAYLFYTLVDGNDKELGVGQYNSATNQVSRIHIFENIISGTRYKPVSNPLNFSSGSILSISNNMEALLQTHQKWECCPLQLTGNNSTTVDNQEVITLATSADYFQVKTMLPSNLVAGQTARIEWLVQNTVDESGIARLNGAWKQLEAGSTGQGSTLVTDLSFTDANPIIEQLTTTEINTLHTGYHATWYLDREDTATTITGNVLVWGARISVLTDKHGTFSPYPDYNDWGAL